MLLSQLDLRGKLLVLNQIKTQADNAIKAYKEMVKPEVIAAESKTIIVHDTDGSQVGYFKLTKSSSKTVEEVLKKKKEDMEALQQEIESLELLCKDSKDMIVTTTQGALRCNASEETKEYVTMMLKDLL